jgi:DNA mismatch endonuclease (patch repair protein)
MTDKLTPELRSENMRRIKSKNMKPEMTVRGIIHGMGFRYRLHRRDLPGKPDIVLSARRQVIFVHGCFWHSHDNPSCTDGQRKPKSNLDYWLPKLARNHERDLANLASLRDSGWTVLVVWECETKDKEALKQSLSAFLGSRNRQFRHCGTLFSVPPSGLRPKCALKQHHGQNPGST